jgi:hypothetical protein
MLVRDVSSKVNKHKKIFSHDFYLNTTVIFKIESRPTKSCPCIVGKVERNRRPNSHEHRRRFDENSSCMVALDGAG